MALYIPALCVAGTTTLPVNFEKIRIRWNLDKDVPLFKPCYNIVPGKDVPVVVREGERNQMKLMRLGFGSVVG